MPREIHVTVKPDGTPTVEAVGFAGKGCADATMAIEIALSGSAVADSDRKKKPDFFATTNSTHSMKQG